MRPQALPCERCHDLRCQRRSQNWSGFVRRMEQPGDGSRQEGSDLKEDVGKNHCPEDSAARSWQQRQVLNSKGCDQ